MWVIADAQVCNKNKFKKIKKLKESLIENCEDKIQKNRKKKIIFMRHRNRLFLGQEWWGKTSIFQIGDTYKNKHEP